MPEVRLGDVIDDYCVKCKRIMNHSVVSMLNGEPAKMRCRTCHSDHDYRHEQAPPPKVDLRKAALFNEVLGKVDPEAAAVDPPEAEAEDVEVEVEAEEAAPVPPAPPVKARKKVKAKAKAKGK